TYERRSEEEIPDLSFATSEILPKTLSFFPKAADLDVIDCQAGFRVKRLGHYHPMIEQIKPSLWAITAMGSRGLLYHAYTARILADVILSGDASSIPSEMR
ncbi:MAG: FAD-binding oxidoreductase, partial [Chlamydiales bacterium]|nr:FAD-binding oxidoreductase [Chlamydiales bacterium]